MKSARTYLRSFLFGALLALICLLGFVCILFVRSALHMSFVQKRFEKLPTSIVVGDETRQFRINSTSLISPKSKQDFFSKSPTPPNPFDRELVQSWVTTIEQSVLTADEPATIVIKNAKPSLFVGKYGRALQRNTLIETIVSMNEQTSLPLPLPLSQTGYVLNSQEMEQAQKRLTTLSSLSLTLTDTPYTKKLSGNELLAFINLPTGYKDTTITQLTQDLSTVIKTPASEPVLEIEGKKVVRFVAPKDGKDIDQTLFSSLIQELLSSMEENKKSTSAAVPLKKTPPTTTLSSLNTLGINERLGMGESMYTHSIPNRIHNVSLATSKIHGTLIAPGEEFSFNKALGDVSAATGYKQAYVIKSGKTELGDGGGVCQVSSTTFRAALSSGLPITARRGHAYRVGYYEQNSQPGFDATVYAPNPDLKFRNDTSNYILINAQADPKNLSMYIEFWGTKDGRSATISNYSKGASVPPPPPVYQDDPTLPPGKIVQVEFATAGLKTSFDYTVIYPDGSIKSQTFKTNFVPWRSVFLRGI